MELELIPSFQASLSLLKGLAQVGVKVEFMVFLELNSTFQSPEPFPGLSSEYLDESSLWRGGDCRLPHFMEYNCNAGYGEVNISIPLSVNVPAIGNETSELDVASSAARSSYSLFSGCVATAYDAEIILLVAVDTVSSLSDKKKEALQTILMWTLGMTDIEPDFVNITSVSSVTGEISITLRREGERNRREAAKSRREEASHREGSPSNATPNVSMRRSSSMEQLKAGLSSKMLGLNSSTDRSFRMKVVASATDTGKKEAPEVVTNYVYDMPEKKSKVKADYDDIDDLENDDFDHDLSDEDEEDEDEFNFELRPLVSEDEDEMAYFSHRMGGSDFKLLRRHVLHPHGRIRSIWDTVALVLIIWVLIIVPFELCFNMNDSLRRRILHFDLFVDAMFVVDIAFNFNTAVEDDGKLHFSLPSIFRHYTRGWFVPEVLWTLPFYAIFEAHDSEAYGSGGSPTNPLFRFASRSAWFYPTVRCLRLMRVVGLPRLQRRLEHSLLISSRVSSLGSFLFVVLALSHVFSCLFAYLAFNDEDQLEFAIYSRVLQDSELKTRYIAAFYWSMMTMTTVGYGDITVKTNAGRLFSLAAMIVGAGVFAYGITNVVSLFQQLYENDTAYRRDMDQINDFMQARMLPRALRDKVRANTFHWRKAARGENKERDRAIVERMASLIRAKVADRFCEEMMPRKMPFLAGCSAEFIHDLYLRMRVQCYLPGEDIISQGDYGSEMFFLFAGHAQVLLGITKVALFGPNSCFGEFSIANPRKPRLATIQALDFCETHCIDREQILRILLRHPITLRSARQLATLRSRKALTLIYETGGKSRTLLQGLAMVWRAEGVQGVLPAGVLPDSLPFLQEFAVTHSMVRGNSVASSVFVPQFQLQQLHPHNLDPAQVSQLQQYNATMGPNTGTTTAPLTSSLTGSARRQSIVVDPTSSRRQSLVVDPTIALATTSGIPSHHQRGRVTKLPKIIPDGPSASDLPLKERDAVSARKVVNALAGGRPKLTRSGSTTNLRMGIPLAVLPPVAAAPPPPQDDRLEQLLTEIRNVASRQNVLEQQLKAMLESAYPGPETQSSKLDSGIIAYEKGRFDEQHWIDRQHAPPLTRDRSARHIDRKIHRDGADT
ncbi:hypothetical protein KRP22_001749 [Phytophthora ramorum]|nr:Potassium voltage-gated channel subfamily H member 7 [Phytophthora ramorum]